MCCDRQAARTRPHSPRLRLRRQAVTLVRRTAKGTLQVRAPYHVHCIFAGHLEPIATPICQSAAVRLCHCVPLLCNACMCQGVVHAGCERTANDGFVSLAVWRYGLAWRYGFVSLAVWPAQLWPAQPRGGCPQHYRATVVPTRAQRRRIAGTLRLLQCSLP